VERKAYTRYSREFKLEAVRLAALGEKPKARIARELGIRVNQLRKWRLEFEQEERTGAPKRGPVMDDDLGWLRGENAELKEENEILKKRPISPRSRCEIRLRSEAPRGLASAVDMRGTRRLAQWLLCVDEQTQKPAQP
jgi:transposase